MRYGAGDIFSFMMLNFDYYSKRLLWLTVYNSPPEVVFEMSDLRRDEGSNTHFWLPYKGTRTDWPQRCARIKRPRPFKETQTRRISNTQNFSKWTSHQVGMYVLSMYQKYISIVSIMRSLTWGKSSFYFEKLYSVLFAFWYCTVCLN